MHNDLISTYTEVLKGYSKLKSSLFHAYFKHPGPFDISALEEERIFIRERVENSGLPTEKEQLTRLDQLGLWTKKDEAEIADAKLFLRGLNDSKEKMSLISQINIIKGQIVETEKKLSELEAKKRGLIGLTVESISEKQANEFFVWFTLYRDPGCREHYFSKEDFDVLSNEELNEIIIAQNKTVRNFATATLQKIALAPYFTNFFYLSNDDPRSFFGKAIIDLSNYQAELFGLGRYFKSLISQYDGKVPEELYETPDKLITWVTSAVNSKKMLDKAGDSSAVGIVGATKEDLAAINTPVMNLAAEAKKRGGKLSMKDMMELHA